jgi:DNA-3-methyladenine glycosylase I
MKKRCPWPKDDPLMIAYHDTEWGVPLHDDRKLFEFMVLDAFQAGLSWSTILHKRENMRAAFDDFDPQKIASYGEKKLVELLADSGIIRNRAKINATVVNAKVLLQIQEEFGSFDKYIWQLAGGVPKVNHWENDGELPARTPESDDLSRELKKRGFKFVGSTICYAFMQGAGMVNDHVVSCFRHKEVSRMGKKK